MEKKITTGILILTWGGLVLCIAIPFLIPEESPRTAASYAVYLSIQHVIGWLISLAGLGFLIFHVFKTPGEVHYEVLNAKNLILMVYLLIFLNFAHFSISQPFPPGGETIEPPYVQFVSTILCVLITGLLVHRVIKKNFFPRRQLILLVMYMLYFVDGILLTSFIQHNLPVSYYSVPEVANLHPMQMVALVSLVMVLLSLSALKKKQSALEQVFAEMEKLKKMKNASKSQEEKLKKVSIAPEMVEALKALDSVLNPKESPPKPKPEDILKKVVEELQGKIKELEIRKDHDEREQELMELLRLYAAQSLANAPRPPSEEDGKEEGGGTEGQADKENGDKSGREKTEQESNK